ncbi:extensin family protein [Luteimonas kalidii]|uniref:Extensin family protein n=1 Tax=Luteimonas kalidii TaxID=3042025 RepID=A0ABT6JS35_9GAMM|nr:extensin family protein [Luteimonas kalidii]MDH5833499.1 extensin family protein [Luteimonas kalidii]
MSSPPRRHYGGLLFLLLIALLAWALIDGALRIPDRWNPFAPLRIDDTPNLLTRYKLDRASADPAACREALAQADMRYQPMEDRVTGEGCGFDNAVRISRTSGAVGEAFSLSCRAALSLAMWERHSLQQAAQAHLDSPVARIEHFGSYSCRNLYGREGGRRSRHATADAFDIAGFVLEDGRRVRVLGDWGEAGAAPPATAVGDATAASEREEIAAAAPASRDSASAPERDETSTPEAPVSDEAAFLRAVRDGACQWFDAVLGPDYNAAHADHFHFDRGGGRICR